jgi:hypothetical protein
MNEAGEAVAVSVGDGEAESDGSGNAESDGDGLAGSDGDALADGEAVASSSNNGVSSEEAKLECDGSALGVLSRVAGELAVGDTIWSAPEDPFWACT